MTLGTSTFVRDLNDRQKLWRTSVPFTCTEHRRRPGARPFEHDKIEHTVNHIVSSLCVPEMVIAQGQPEVYLFASDENGDILDWLEMSGSQKGTTDHYLTMCDSDFPPAPAPPCIDEGCPHHGTPHGCYNRPPSDS